MPDGELEYVDPFPGRKGSERVRIDCTKCRGRGRLSTIVDGGRCWGCGGSGLVSVLVSSERSPASVGHRHLHGPGLPRLRRLGQPWTVRLP